LGPAWVGIGGQGALPLHLGPRCHPGGLADLDQLSAARLGEAEVPERAERHRELVDAELRMAVQLVGARRGAAGLQVDDHGPALLVGFQPVHPGR